MTINKSQKSARPSTQRRVGIPSGWSIDQRILLSIAPGDPSRRRQIGGTFSTLWRSTAVFGVHREGIQSSCFFGIAPNVKNKEAKSNLGAHVAILEPQTWLVSSLLALSFHFCERPTIKKTVCFSMLLNGFRPLSPLHFPIEFTSRFSFFPFSKPFTGTVFRGVQVPNWYKKIFWGVIFDFYDFQKGNLWASLSFQKDEIKKYPQQPGLSFKRPCFSRSHSN